MHTVIINIGSNLGQRRHNLSRAMAAVGNTFGPFELSHVVESEPWGFNSTNKFLNVGMTFQSDMEPLDILQQLKRIEKQISDTAHRDSAGNYIDRIIDIDIIAIDELIINTDNLKIPHPHLAERDFFLVPLEELAGLWRHPVSKLNATEMLAQLDRRTARDASGEATAHKTMDD